MNDIKIDALVNNLVSVAKQRGVTLATAESCTGGLIGAVLTTIPGVSAVYLGGVVSYANTVKSSVLGVSEEILARDGAVSAACASAMATGVRTVLRADYAVSVTGIAGPDGGSEDKPVGLVYFGLATPDGAVVVDRAVFPGDRDAVRKATVEHALGMLTVALI